MHPEILTDRLSDDDAALPVDAVPDEPEVRANEQSILGLAELLLKAPARIDALTRDATRQAELIPRLLALTLLSTSLFAVVLVALLLAAPAGALPVVLGDRWSTSAGAALALAYPVGLVAAAGLCLPSFYFFGLLAGVRASALEITAHVLKGEAATAVLLLGLLPIYLAVALGLLICHAPDQPVELTLNLGLVLPFIAGLWGVRSIYRGFLGLADTLPPERRRRRTVFLRRLTLSWAAVYTAVTPVMIATLYQHLAARLA
jgi:hypothetical protein